MLFDIKYRSANIPYLVCQKNGNLDLESFPMRLIILPFASNTEFNFLQSFSNFL